MAHENEIDFLPIKYSPVENRISDTGDDISKTLSDLGDSIMERREGERRAAVHEPAPTGDGEIVLGYVDQKLHIMLKTAELPTALPSLIPAEGLRILREDLKERAQVGKAKYGTYLRVNNGRNATMDLYQELCDSIMYSAQARMEGKPAGLFVELLVNIASQTALLLKNGN